MYRIYMNIYIYIYAYNIYKDCDVHSFSTLTQCGAL